MVELLQKIDKFLFLVTPQSTANLQQPVTSLNEP